FARQFDFAIHTSQDIDGSLITRLPHLIYAYECLNKADGNALSLVCANAKAHGYKALLTGDSADELFAGYGSFEAFRIHQFVKNLPGWQRALSILNKVMPGFRSINIDSIHHHISPFDDRFLRSFLDFTLSKFDREGDWKKNLTAYDFIGNKYEQYTNAFLLDEVKHRLQRFTLRADRVGMSNGIELRLPFLSKEIASFALNLPFQKKSVLSPSLTRRRMFWDKAPLRSVARNLHVSEKIIKRVKIGTPIGDLDTLNLFKLIEKIDLGEVANAVGLDQNSLKEAINMIEFQPAKYRLAWTFLSLDILVNLFIHGISPFEMEQRLKHALRT
ncbi:MAG: asparagine synthase C-terminal domain-containing protein, partial [Emcibacteraceae bacterium]|nr:asparagine synthase C-terminal domain-containing protein [Emcibacteraceae bacterium]